MTTNSQDGTVTSRTISIDADEEAEPMSTEDATADIRSVLRRLTVGDRIVYQTERYPKVDPLRVTETTSVEEVDGVVRTVELRGPGEGRHRIVDDTSGDVIRGYHVNADGHETSQGPVCLLLLLSGAV